MDLNSTNEENGAEYVEVDIEHLDSVSEALIDYHSSEGDHFAKDFYSRGDHGHSELDADNSSITFNEDELKSLNLSGSRCSSCSSLVGTGMEPNLDNLPPELFYYICTFIDSRFLSETLAYVCSLFFRLIRDEETWRIRMKYRWRQPYILPPRSRYRYHCFQSYLQREETHKMWDNPEKTTDHFHVTDNYAAIDCVHLMDTGDRLLCATGSRDRSLKVYDLSKFDPTKKSAEVANEARVLDWSAHDGWVWCLASKENLLSSGSWDKNIRIFDLNREGECIHSIKTKTAVISLKFSDFIISAGFDKKVTLYDPRTYESVMTLGRHSMPVLAVEYDGTHLVSASEDKKVCVFDLRGNKQPLVQLDMEKYVMCLSMEFGQLWMGDRQGAVHLVDCNRGLFAKVSSGAAHDGKLTDIAHSLGCVATCSTDNSIKIWEPSSFGGRQYLIRQLKVSSLPVTSLALNVRHQVFMAGVTDMSFHVWRPKSEYNSSIN